MGTAAPDVRIRLSAEGVQEVVAAFRQIQAEAARTAQASRTAGEGHAFLNKQLASLKSLLPMLGVAALVAGFISAAKSGIELADDLGKLQQKTALTGDTLSTLAFAARFADVEQEALGKGLVRFTKSMDDYDKRATTARGAIKALFGDPNALQGLNMDQRLQKIVQRMAELGPGTVRTGAAIALFGKAGADLLPVMDELGAQGFDRLRERAKKLGLDLSDDAVQGAENLKRSLITLKAEAQGMATQFLLGLAAALEALLVALGLLGLLDRAGDGFQRLLPRRNRAADGRERLRAFLVERGSPDKTPEERVQRLVFRRARVLPISRELHRRHRVDHQPGALLIGYQYRLIRRSLHRLAEPQHLVAHAIRLAARPCEDLIG